MICRFPTAKHRFPIPSLCWADMSTDANSSYVPGSASVVYLTAPNTELAKTMARGLVEQKLAACVNIVPNITSIYRWDDKLQEDAEVMMIVKTMTTSVDAISEFVRQNHTYDVAEVISMPIQNGNEPYLKFLQDAIEPTDEKALD